MIFISWGVVADEIDNEKIRQTLFYGQGNLAGLISEAAVTEFFPEATAYGQIQEKPPRIEVLKGEEVIGHVILNSDYVNTNGYSGKPIHILIGLDKAFNITAAKLVKHSEPIVLIGIPIEKVNAYIDAYQGRNYSGGDLNQPAPEVISGATVTVMVINETIARASLLAARGMSGATEEQAAAPEFLYEVNREAASPADWQGFVDEKTLGHLRLSVGEVNEVFTKSPHPEAAEKGESADANAEFIDLYFAPVSVPAIGRALLGEAGYAQLAKRLQPGQEALMVAGNGLYSFKGSGYVRGGMFDRLKIKQGGSGFHFRDLNHMRLADVRVKGAPRFREVALFVVPEGSTLDLTEKFDAELLVHRAIGATEKAFVTFDAPYQLPENYLTKTANPDYVPPVPKTETAVAATDAMPATDGMGSIQEKIAREAWQAKTVQIVVLGIALVVLTGVFFFQDWFAKRPVLYKRFRIAYLCFTLFWLGGYLGAQLSVVNVLTFTNSLISGFSWTYFLMDPVIFILWCATAFGALLWNRGAFCGWLCPFGALQELTSAIAKKLGVKQIKLPFKVHERMTALKYIIFLLLFGFSLYDLGLAEHLAEVEPFKTSIILKFQRAWPYVAFALILVAIGLFIERFYCRYLCPLGAALAIPAKLRLFNWLKRYRECGNPCQKCAQECPVEAIFPEGNINENECIQCLNCQVLYHDQKRCMHLLQEIAKAQKAAERKKRVEAIKSGDISLETHS
ncbi:MAG: 4Fe-4S binding protein [Cardiobacteriaceae bacterium]|nr:4Fe-4S binding protein [Cardiobacteriaceae bacterium]